jgi:hypothetical protein
MKRLATLFVAVLGVTLSAQLAPLVIRQAPVDAIVPGLSFADAMEIVRGNQAVLQATRDRECRGAAISECGADLPVRARKALDTYDDQAEQILLQLAATIRDTASDGPLETVVFETIGLPYRNEPRRGLQALRDALRESHVTLVIRDKGSAGAATRGLARLRDFTGAERFREEPLKPAGGANAKVVKPLPVAVTAAMAHAARFAEQAATLLAEEHYLQEVKTRPSSGSRSSMSRTSTAGITIERRVLDSEVALIHVIDGQLWLLARDVQRVDGKPVPEAQRIPLPTVHPSSAPEALKKFKEIAAQGARFNIGAISRDLNIPTLAIWLLTPAISTRLAFSEAGKETINGKSCDVIRFKEKGEPYLFDADGEPKPVSGRFWIDGAQSIVVKTELILEGRSSAIATSRAQVTVSYGFEPALSAWVPQTMIERYDGRASPAFVTGTSTYTNYRQFGVTARIVK